MESKSNVTEVVTQVEPKVDFAEVVTPIDLPERRGSVNFVDALRSIEPRQRRGSLDSFCSTYEDIVHMGRMGKKQEMNRVFKQVSLISFTAICMSTWEWIIMSNSQGLLNGGRAGLVWSYFWSFIGYSLLAASLAEMAAMAPTAGGQYHWTSEFAPPKYQRFLSYFSGWLAVLSWQSGNASGIFLQGYMIQSLIGLRNPSYTLPPWQCWLLVVAVSALCCAINIFSEKWFADMQGFFMFMHIAGFIATIAVLWGLGPRISAAEALTEFKDSAGWGNLGIALSVGQLTSVFALGGTDAAAHMSEEVQDSGLTVPRTIFWTILINGLLGLIAAISFVFAMPSVEAALNDPSGFSMFYVFRQCGGTPAVLGLVLIQLFLLMVGNISYQASTARQTFAFARDGGTPFAGWISTVNKRFLVPVNSILFTGAFSIAISLIDLGSSDAFNAILSLYAVAQMTTYSLSLGCMLYRRITAPHLLPQAQWTLGRWGVLVNGCGMAYSMYVWVFMFFPASIPVTASSMNYAVVMFFGVLAIAAGFFVVQARKTYFGPATKTAGYESEE